MLDKRFRAVSQACLDISGHIWTCPTCLELVEPEGVFAPPPLAAAEPPRIALVASAPPSASAR